MDLIETGMNDDASIEVISNYKVCDQDSNYQNDLII